MITSDLPSRDGADRRFGRLFPDLPPWTEDLPPGTTPEEASREVLLRFIQTKEDRTVDTNPRIPAGYTYFGQFLTHDLSHDVAPLAGLRRSAAVHPSLRSARLDLDSVYGLGPEAQPYLYAGGRADDLRAGAFGFETVDGKKKKSKKEGTGILDFVRTPDGRAVIADSRNDQHVIVAHMHRAFQRFHNAVYEQALEKHASPSRAFAEAHAETCRHFQWIVVNDYLPRLTGLGFDPHDPASSFVEHFGPRRLFPGTEDARVPLEFTAAVLRFGHVMARNRYRLNGEMESALPLLHAEEGPSLEGGRRLSPELRVDWTYLFDSQSRVERRTQYARRFLRWEPDSFRHLPNSLAETPKRLLERDLQRGAHHGLPSGQRIARELGLAATLVVPGNDSLWYYVIREAAYLRDGYLLGPLGSRLLADVLLGLIESDPRSYLHAQPRWYPRWAGARMDLFSFLRLAEEGLPVTAKRRSKQDYQLPRNTTIAAAPTETAKKSRNGKSVKEPKKIKTKSKSRRS